MSAKFVRSYDFSRIKSKSYRTLTKKYIWNGSNHNLIYLYDQLIILTIILNYLYKLKSKNKYPNPNLKKINIHEANIIKNHIKKMDSAFETKNSYINATKRFFQFQKDNNYMEFEILVFSYLNLISYRKRNKAKAIPDDDLIKINTVMKEKIESSHFNLLCYAIFHIALQTEFRISQICYLKTNCIQNTLKNNQFEIKTSSKTSNNQEYKAIISDLTKKHIDHVIIKSKKIRDMCSDKKVNDYLFLYKSQQNRYKPVNSHTFRKHFINCCQESGVPKYTSNNIRDTHMTKAAEFNMRNNKNQASMAILSGHKRVDTTNNHYIEMQLIRMLESTYGIIIGNVNCNGKIVDSINKDISNKKHIVEQGCGYCQKDKCYMTSTISCLMCKDFRTTVDHEKHFEIIINNLDDKIKNAPTEHDKEDLINIKRLYSAYLLEIWKKKEGLFDDQY
jgi:integrase